MHKSLRPIAVSCALAAALLAGGPAPAQNSDQVKQNQEQLDRVRIRIQALQRTIERTRRQQDEILGGIEQAERQIAGIASQLRKLKSETDQQQAKVSAIEKQQAEAQARLDEQRVALGRQVRAAYAIGNQGQAKLLLNQGDAQKLGRVLTYYDFLNRARTARVAVIDGQLKGLAEIAAELKAQAAELAALRQKQEQTLTELRSSQAQRTANLAKLKERLADDVDQLRNLRESEKSIQDLIASLRDVLADIPVELGSEDVQPFPGLKGRLDWPLRGRLLANYGQAKAGGKLTWNGLWIEADEGAAVKAVARGRVVYVGWMHRYGLIAIVEHEGGYFSLYGHAQSVAKAAGDWVDAGEVLAAAGSTGGHEQSGVYLEVRKGTTPLNPNEWLTKE